VLLKHPRFETSRKDFQGSAGVNVPADQGKRTQ